MNTTNNLGNSLGQQPVPPQAGLLNVLCHELQDISISYASALEKLDRLNDVIFGDVVKSEKDGVTASYRPAYEAKNASDSLEKIAAHLRVQADYLNVRIAALQKLVS